MSNQLFQQAQQNLQKYWGYNSFLEGQKEAIQSVLAGEPTLVLFPTGGGKSVCYQLPATVLDGVTLVISPLIALMQDQVEQLNQRDISATFINSTLSRRETEQRLVNARNGLYDLLYCSPERLDTELWNTQLPNMNVSLVAIDEAHCISEWGHDFRPDYRNIPVALESIADSTRWIALTATATPEVRDDIIDNLHFDEPTIVSTGFERSNLKWWVVGNTKKKEKLIQSVYKGAKDGSGIVYAGTRRNCEELAELISNKLDIKTAAYHAGVDSAQRSAIQEAWIADELPLVVATSAFGMGIDKADCRYVVHYQMPYSLEAYYQQAGRAGRDGELSYPILLFKEADIYKANDRIESSYPNKKQLQKTYDAFCDELNLAVGTTHDTMQTIAIEALKKRSNLTYNLVKASLNTLKNLQIIEYQKDQIPQVGIRFMVRVDALRQRIANEDNKEKATFLDLLYRRLGESAFDELTYVRLKTIQQKAGITQNGIIKALQVLKNHDHLLEFELLRDRPMVRLLDERVSTLRVSKKNLEEGRNRLLKKLDYMKGYINTTGCRERYIRRYFGESVSKRCGHCDNCLRRNENEADAISTDDVMKVKDLLNESSKSIKIIKNKLSWKRDKLKRVIRYLIREEKVIIDDDKVSWVK